MVERSIASKSLLTERTFTLVEKFCQQVIFSVGPGRGGKRTK